MMGKLILADGNEFSGRVRGAQAPVVGEVVFNTGMTGFQEVLTDPSYCGQIVTMTYPLIGNYGVSPNYNESARPHARGFIVRELCDHPSNWQADMNVDAFLARYGITCLEGVDTRAVTRRIRRYGAMRGVIAVGDDGAVPEEPAEALVRQVSTKVVYRIPGPGRRVVVMDYGVKHNILRALINKGCDLTVVPAGTDADIIKAMDPDGIFLSNGPGDPKDVSFAVDTIKALLGYRPIFGICLGHQLLALALGGDTYKLKFGHRGANHPVKDCITGRVYITSQNHGYAVNERSLGPETVVSHRSLHDGTVEGLIHRHLPVFSVQYHPEAAPGPTDSAYLFDKFLAMMAGGSHSCQNNRN